jgi:hypothetical protein
MTMNFNVFTAAAQAKLERVVWASSETTLGLPFEVPPRYAPVDEDHYPVPTSTYALAKTALWDSRGIGERCLFCGVGLFSGRMPAGPGGGPGRPGWRVAWPPAPGGVRAARLPGPHLQAGRPGQRAGHADELVGQ